MSDREQYARGPARAAQIPKDREKRTLIPVKELRPPPEKPGQALTGTAYLREGSPFVSDGSPRTVETVKLTTVGALATHALLDRLEDHLDGREPADMFKRLAGARSLYG